MSAVGPANSSIRFGRSFKLDKPVTDVRMFYIGREGRTLTNLLISYSRSQVRQQPAGNLAETLQQVRG
jgi:hypothetical protein